MKLAMSESFTWAFFSRGRTELGYEQHGNRRAVQRAVCDAAEQRALQPARCAGAQDQHVGAMLRDCLQQARDSGAASDTDLQPASIGPWASQ